MTRPFIFEIGIMTKLLLVLFACMLGMASVGARAEGGCPPGTAPQQGQGWQSCVPVAGSNQDSVNNPADAPAWANSWQAIATDDSKGILGTSIGKLSRLTAEGAAVDDCVAKGGTDCKVQLSNANGCVAMAVGKERMRIMSAASKKDAEKKTLAACKEEDKTCVMYYSECSLAQRVR